jgi:hypothetical protein
VPFVVHSAGVPWGAVLLLSGTVSGVLASPTPADASTPMQIAVRSVRNKRPFGTGLDSRLFIALPPRQVYVPSLGGPASPQTSSDAYPFVGWPRAKESRMPHRARLAYRSLVPSSSPSSSIDDQAIMNLEHVGTRFKRESTDIALRLLGGRPSLRWSPTTFIALPERICVAFKTGTAR